MSKGIIVDTEECKDKGINEDFLDEMFEINMKIQDGAD